MEEKRCRESRLCRLLGNPVVYQIVVLLDAGGPLTPSKLAKIPCESVPEAAGDHYAKIKLTRQQKGLVLDENDLWIAATALALDAVLITRDTDFQHIEGLSVNDWTV